MILNGSTPTWKCSIIYRFLTKPMTHEDGRLKRVLCNITYSWMFMASGFQNTDLDRNKSRTRQNITALLWIKTATTYRVTTPFGHVLLFDAWMLNIIWSRLVHQTSELTVTAVTHACLKLKRLSPTVFVAVARNTKGHFLGSPTFQGIKKCKNVLSFVDEKKILFLKRDTFSRSVLFLKRLETVHNFLNFSLITVNNNRVSFSWDGDKQYAISISSFCCIRQVCNSISILYGNFNSIVTVQVVI